MNAMIKMAERFWPEDTEFQDMLKRLDSGEVNVSIKTTWSDADKKLAAEVLGHE